MKINFNTNFIYTSALVASAVLFSGCAGQKGGASSCGPCAAAAAMTTTNPAAATPPPASAVPEPVAIAAPTAAEKVVLKVVRVDSEETAGENGAGANAVDGDPNTVWHTQWQDATPECPHEIVIELTPAATIKGFTYLPRQDDSDHGDIKGYEFYVSNDGQNFGQPVAHGEFENSKELKTVAFAPTAARFIKLKALSEVNDEAWTSAAEIGVVVK
ncbi:MAG TPA: discoidin domain-containing protein [Verrucomicrobiae bacterium]